MNNHNSADRADEPSRGGKLPAPVKVALSVFGVLSGLAVIGFLLLSFMLMMAYPNLPDIDSLATYQPKMPLRVFSADNVLIGEFGEERRSLVRYKDIPTVMKQAVLAIEDDRFYQHHGVDYWGILRAAIHNAIGGSRRAHRRSRSRSRATSSCPASRPSSASCMKSCWHGRSRRR